MSRAPKIKAPSGPPAQGIKKTSEPLPWKTRIIYGFGGILDQWGAHGIKNLANPIFNIILGVNPAIVGGMVALSRLWDAFTDPFMGSLSDNARTRWGRRKPFMALGALACALTFIPLWGIPIDLSTSQQTAWLLVSSLLFYTSFTIFSVPYHAIGYETAPSYHQKTQLFAVRTVFTVVVSMAVAWIFPLTQSGWLGDPVTSVRWLILIIALVILASGLLPAIFLKERTQYQIRKEVKIPLRTSLPAAARSRDFVRILFAAGSTVIGLNMVNALGNYVSIYYVFGGDAKAAAPVIGWQGTLYGIVVLLGVPLITSVSKRIGKRRAFQLCLLSALAGTIGKWWLYDPNHPWWQLGVVVLLAPGMSGLWLLSESMVADVAQYEHWKTGRKSEGVFGAVYSWFLKSGLALGVFLSGLILVFTGFDVSLGSDQDPATLLRLRVLFSFLPATAILFALWLLRGYNLDADRMAEIQADLDKREAASTE